MPKRPSQRIKLIVSEKDKRKSLQDLDGQNWGEPPFPSHVVTECHRLHRTPLNEFRVEDLRLMIGQQFCLPYLLPLAVVRLREAPLASGDFYPGDLLQSVLRIDPAFWEEYPQWRRQIEDVLLRVPELPDLLTHDAAAFRRRTRISPVER